MGRVTDAPEAPEPGERFIWEIPDANFGPIYMVVARVIGGQKPRVIFNCWGPDGRAFRRPHRAFLPLSEFVRRANWTDFDLMKARLNYDDEKDKRP
jgi:hypothetical protein